MSDKLSYEEINALTGHDNLSVELDPLKDILNNSLNTFVEKLSSKINLTPIQVEAPTIDTMTANNLTFENGDIIVKIGFNNGLSGYSYLNVSKADSIVLASSLKGIENTSDLSSDEAENTLCIAIKEIAGYVSDVLSKNLNDSVTTTPASVILKELANVDNLFNEEFKGDIKICKISYDLKFGSILAKLSFVFVINTAKSAAFKIRKAQSKNLLGLNTKLAETVAEFFTLLSTKYKPIYSMVGIIDNVSVTELTPIHSIQCLDRSVITGYNIINKDLEQNLHNAFLFDNKFISDVKRNLGILNDEERTWDILKDLNNQLSCIFSGYCLDDSLSFSDVECTNLLELPDSQYLLVSYTISGYKFYQVLSFSLVDKFTKSLDVLDRSTIDSKSVENLVKYGCNSDEPHTGSINPSSIANIPSLFRKLPLEVSVELGEKVYTIKELLHLSSGYIIHFNKKASEDMDICINNIKKAEGEIGELKYNKSNTYAVKIKKIITG